MNTKNEDVVVVAVVATIATVVISVMTIADVTTRNLQRRQQNLLRRSLSQRKRRNKNYTFIGSYDTLYPFCCCIILLWKKLLSLVLNVVKRYLLMIRH